MFDVRYFVNEEKRTVVCKLSGCFSALNCDICDRDYPPHPALEIDNEFTGKAQCSPEDDFDIAVGKRIAYKRAVAKMIRAKRRALLEFMAVQKRDMNEFIITASKLVEKYNRSIDRKYQDIAITLGGEKEN
jgi:hypothetical protein